MGRWCEVAVAVLLAVTSSVAQVRRTTSPPLIPFFPEGENLYFDIDPSHPLYSEMTAESSRLTPNIPTRKSPEGKSTARNTCPDNQWPVMCGTYSLSAGQCMTFTSPYFPDLYSPKFNCMWTFEVRLTNAAGDDEELEMTCSDFSLARRIDSLQIDSDGSRYVEYKGGNAPPSPTTTSGGVLKAYFKSDRRRNAMGFKCVVRNVASGSTTSTTTASPATTTSQGDGPPLSHPNCGQRNARIINGKETKTNEFPWQVWVLTYWTDGKAASCGGSIINEDWVVTAAHCLSRDVDISSIRVAVGAHLKEDPAAHGGKNVFAANYIIHQQYNFPANDIAVIRLKSSLTFSQNVGPVCLAPRSWVTDDFVGDLVIISGWGQTEEGTGSSYLRYVETTGVSLQDCRAIYGQGTPDMVMCTDSSDVEKACYGDSGGPVTTAKSGRSFLVGLVSFGRTCSANVPDGHCRVAYMIDWIESATGLTFPI